MDLISEVRQLAVIRTKEKVLEDINYYLGKQEELQPFRDYLYERGHYIDQIWMNVWLNKVSNDISRKEKKLYLKERNFEVDGAPRKYINHLFRTEMKSYDPFDVGSWLKETFLNQGNKWEERYVQAREEFLENQKKEQLEKEKQEVRSHLNESVISILEKENSKLYLYLRYELAKQIVKDLRTSKYRLVDEGHYGDKLISDSLFNENDYKNVEDFLYELTGSTEKTIYWEYERYFDKYNRMLEEILLDNISEKILNQLPVSLKEKFFNITNETLSCWHIYEILTEPLNNIQTVFMEKLKEEYIADLITLAAIPFDMVIHEEIYKLDLEKKEQRKKNEAEAIEREKVAEDRMLKDIFGREYSPSYLRNIQYVLHIGETNTGKTHHALEKMKRASSGLYLAPLRLLALEVYDKLNSEGIPCGLKTGEEEKEVEGTSHLSCTVEMFHEREFYEVIVIDEAQMITDKDRGFSWFKAITKANAKEVHIIGSLNSKDMVLELLGDAQVDVKEYRRDVPLEVEQKLFRMKHTVKGDALVCFSRKRVLETASLLENEGHSVSMVYGSMPPETRKKQMKRFINGEATVIVSTDAIGMGLNLPIRRIVFLENEKFDGTGRRRLTSQEVKQIAGRAGRKGIYNVGKVAFMTDIKVMTRLLEQVDEPVHTFTVAPTTAIFERFQRYSRDMGYFFHLWDKFESPKGTKKASLTEERELYTFVQNTEIEARLPLMELYGFLHLPFSTKEVVLIKQWRDTMEALVKGEELPEPQIKTGGLEELELSYKALGLHLLFLYRLGRVTEAIYWERLREEISDDVHEKLKTDVKKIRKKCKHCGRNLPFEFKYQICDSCHWTRKERRKYDFFDEFP
ncbi:helicase-related protein [Evansella tamaricis]|uniref:RNA helicase n=1 Tax=Evansella tamaricis TaxID=2069301 RepID=A0ABS6JMI4_9BACI|nr:helicase-related protein [Evansella tamaricis]MBU9714052.1 RNA helicase [Evansella tamaricis]